MYVINNYAGGITRINLSSGSETPLTTKIGTTTVNLYGSIAADGTHVWVVDGAVLYQVDASNGTTLKVTAYKAPASGIGPTAMLSVANFLYVNAWTDGGTYPTLTRIDKNTATATFITADGTGDITGIATDNTRLYLADAAVAGRSLKVVNPTTPYIYPTPPTTPTLATGSVTPLTVAAALAGANGVAVIGGTSYVAERTRIMKVDNATGTVLPLAGYTSAGSSCTSAASGSSARFVIGAFPLRVVGADGRFVYATDDCGIRRINPTTGAVSSLTTNGYFGSNRQNIAIAGQYMYVINNYAGGITRINLSSGSETPLTTKIGTTTVNLYGSIAADGDNLWIADGANLYRVDSNGTAQKVATYQPPASGIGPTAMLSAGSHIYANSWSANGTYPTLTRIDKTTGATTTVATQTSGNITGIATDTTTLYLADATTKSIKKIS